VGSDECDVRYYNGDLSVLQRVIPKGPKDPETQKLKELFMFPLGRTLYNEILSIPKLGFFKVPQFNFEHEMLYANFQKIYNKNIGEIVGEHSILGYTKYVSNGNSDSYEEWFQNRCDYWRDHNCKRGEDQLCEYKNFLELDTDENIQLKFGDLGQFYVFIKKSDLRRAQWINMKTIYDWS